MENAADALKLAFAAIVFVIALWIALSLIGQANSTVRSIFNGLDDTTYLEPARNYNSLSNSGVLSTNGSFRIVGIETIIPTIYRYSIENYGVTILNKYPNSQQYEIVARYDTETDNVMNAGLNKYADISHFDPTLDEIKNCNSHLAYLNIIANTRTKTKDKLEVEKNKWFSSDDDVYNLVIKQYQYTIVDSEGKTQTLYGAPWGSEYVADRIEADLTGKEKNFNGYTYNPFDGNGLMQQMEGKKYMEFIIEDAQQYIAKDYSELFQEEAINDTNINDTNNRNTKKLEILFIEV